jgi:hypothetical protein
VDWYWKLAELCYGQRLTALKLDFRYVLPALQQLLQPYW